MKTSPWILLPVVCFANAVLVTTSFAEAIDYSEVSLLVRAHESEPTIMQEVSRRKLVRALTPQQEVVLRKQGASESLLQALRRPDSLLAAADASIYETRRDEARKSRGNNPSHDGGTFSDPTNGVHVFDVATGHPVNLSQWGGPDYEFSFRAPTRLDEGCPDAVLIDNVRSYTDTSTYLGAGRAEDSMTVFDRRNYVSVMDHSATRGLRIDRHHPLRVKGLPYILYPVYAAGGVSLYYIGGSSDSVKLAISTRAL